MKLFAKALVLVVLSTALAVTAASASGTRGAAGLDSTYGDGGVVKVAPPGPPPEASPYANLDSYGPAADGSTYLLSSVYLCRPSCGHVEYLGRYESDGSRDESFGGNGSVALPEVGTNYSVVADGTGQAVVASFAAKAVVVQRFTSDGAPVTGFGTDDLVRLPCDCKYPQVRLIAEPGGRVLVEVNTSAGSFEEPATRVRLTRLQSDGTVDSSFGTAGTVRFTVHGAGEPSSVVRAAGDATLIGGPGMAGCCGPRQVYLRRVSEGGQVDRGFDRNAARSVRRVATLGRHPTLAALVPRHDGTIAAVGSSKEGQGFYLRLRRDGRLAAGFGTRGLLALPFSPESAVGGVGGSVFAVGANQAYGGYRAFRILSGGGLDPAYKGAAGIQVPLDGVRIRATSLGKGRVLVTDNGNSYCRSACRAEPAMARFLE